MPTRTQPSRSARRQSLSSLNFTPPGKMADTYNEDLDLLALIVGAPRASVAAETTSVDSDSEDYDDDDLVGKNSHKLVLRGLTLLDPLTCDTLRKFSLPFPLDTKRNCSADTFTCSMDAELDLDTVVVKVRPLQGYPLLYLYRLVEDFSDEKVMEGGEKRRRRNSKCASARKRR